MHFGKPFFKFLTDLKADNDREWFNANKQRFVDEVEEPMLRFIADFGDRVTKISKTILANPKRVGGSMFRIYRDTRFSKDKTPYKTAVTAQFAHVGQTKEKAAPGYYIHLEPGTCMGGGGIYHPDSPSLKLIRDRIVAKPKEWAAVVKKIKIDGESLKRPPPGYDADHEFVEDLKRKDLYSMASFTEKQVCSESFLDTYVAECARMAPLNAVLAKALDLDW
jgi:uncharacterized protein (TIGR02453 family)